MASEKETMEKLITDSVILMVKTSLRFRSQIEIRAVICVTVDQGEVSVIHIDKNLRPEDMVKQENCQEVTCTTSPDLEQEHPAKRMKFDGNKSEHAGQDAGTAPAFTDDLDNQSIFQMQCSSNVILSSSSSGGNVAKTSDVASNNASNTNLANRASNSKTNLVANNNNNQLVLASPNKKTIDVKNIVNQLIMQQNQDRQQQQQQNIPQQQRLQQQQQQQQPNAQFNQQQLQHIQLKQQQVMQQQLKQCQMQQQQPPKMFMGTPTKNPAMMQGVRMGSPMANQTPPKQMIRTPMSAPATPIQRVYHHPQQQPNIPPQQQQQRMMQNQLQLSQSPQRAPPNNNNMALAPVRGGRGSRGPRARGGPLVGRGSRGRAKSMNDGWSSVEESGVGGGGDAYSFGKETVVQYVCNICKGYYKSHSSLLNHQVRNHGRQKKVGVGRKPKNQATPTYSNSSGYDFYQNGMEEDDEYAEGGYDDDEYTG